MAVSGLFSKRASMVIPDRSSKGVKGLRTVRTTKLCGPGGAGRVLGAAVQFQGHRLHHLQVRSRVAIARQVLRRRGEHATAQTVRKTRHGTANPTVRAVAVRLTGQGQVRILLFLLLFFVVTIGVAVGISVHIAVGVVPVRIAVGFISVRLCVAGCVRAATDVRTGAR